MKTDYIRTPDSSQRVLDANLAISNTFRLPSYNSVSNPGIGNNPNDAGYLRYNSGIEYYNGTSWVGVTSVTADSGLTLSSGNIRWGGDLQQNTDINLNGKTYIIHNPSFSSYFNQGEDFFILQAGNSSFGQLTGDSTQVTLSYNGGYSRRISITSAGFSIIDANSKGLVNSGDYSTAIIADNNALTSTLAVKQLISTFAPVSNYLLLTGGTLTGDVQQTTMPVNGNSLITRSYVDNLITGITWKQEVKAASVANINIASSLASMDGYTFIANDRLLLKNQTDAKQNGIWVFTAVGSALTRATDADSSSEIGSATVLVRNGSTNKNTQWTCTNSTDPVIGTDNITFGQISGAGTYTNGTGILLSSNVFSLDTSYTDGRYQPIENQRLSTTNSPTFASVNIAGSSGNGFITLNAQSTAPITPITGVQNVYADSLGRFTIMGSNGYSASLSKVNLTASRVYLFPDSAGTFALQSTTLSGYGITDGISTTGTNQNIQNTLDIGSNSHIFYNDTATYGTNLQSRNENITDLTSYTGGQYINTYSLAVINPSTYNSSWQYSGLQGILYKIGSTQVNSLTGVNGVLVNLGNGNINKAYANTGFIVNQGSGTITDGRNFVALSPIASLTSPITNSYGFYVNEQKVTGVANGWSLYSPGVNTQLLQNGNSQFGNGSIFNSSATVNISKDLTSPVLNQPLLNIAGTSLGNNNTTGMQGIYVSISDNSAVTSSTRGNIFGVQANIAPLIARSNPGHDDATNFIANNLSTNGTKAVEAFYVGHNSLFTLGAAEYVASFKTDANANSAFAATGTYTHGIDFISGQIASITGNAIYLPNATKITARNAANSADLNIVNTNSANGLFFGNSLTNLAGGNWGINDTNPLEKLSIDNGSTGGKVKLFTTSTTSGMKMYRYDGTNYSPFMIGSGAGTNGDHIGIFTAASSVPGSETYQLGMAMKNSGVNGPRTYFGGGSDAIATVQLKAGIATTNGGPLAFTTGVTSQTTVQQGVINWDGTNLYIGSTSTPINEQFAYTASPTFTGTTTVSSLIGVNNSYNTGGYSFLVRNTTSGRFETVSPLFSSTTMTVSANTTLTASNFGINGVLTVYASGTITVNLPAASTWGTANSTGTNYILYVINTGTGTITVKGNGTELINNSNTDLTLSSQYNSNTYQSNGTQIYKS